MKRFDGLVLCSDVDGTLINEENIVPKENLEAIAYFQAHGGKFTLVSGRVPEALYPVLSGIRLDFPVISHNGCSIYDTNAHTYIEMVPLSRKASCAAEEIMNLFPEIGVEVMTSEGIFVVRQNHGTDRHLSFEKISGKMSPSFDATPATWLKILFADEPDVIEKVQKKMADSPYRADYTLIRTHRFYFEIFDKTASKGNALKSLCARFSIPAERVIAVGDNDNDISLLQAAGTGFAVKNASKGAKAAARAVTTRTNEEGALAEVIARL